MHEHQHHFQVEALLLRDVHYKLPSEERSHPVHEHPRRFPALEGVPEIKTLKEEPSEIVCIGIHVTDLAAFKQASGVRII